LSGKYLEDSEGRVGFIIWCIVSIFVLFSLGMILRDYAAGMVLTIGNVIVTLAIEFTHYVAYKRDLKEGVIDISKGTEGYEFFPLEMAFTPLIILMFFVCIALLASYRAFIEDRLFREFKE
jgi:hypothetical protein